MTVDATVGAAFADINECAPGAENSCAAEADGGVCANTDGGYECDCATGYSGDGRACFADKRASLLARPGGSVSANPSGPVAHGTTVTFTATPDSGYTLSAWLGGCAGTAGLTCDLTLTVDATVGAEFGDINECAAPAAGCAAEAEGGFCANTAGSFECGCAAGYSGDGRSCVENRRISLLATRNGRVESDYPAGAAPGTTVTFTAVPASGYTLSAWREDCAAAAGLECVLTVTVDVTVGAEFSDINECAPGAENTCAADERCFNMPGGFQCGSDCAALGREEGAGDECGDCAAGRGEINMRCVSEDEEDALPETEDTCKGIFGGEWEATGTGFRCSEIDINDTFCLADSPLALSCRGLFNHVRVCNLLGRPALDPFHCAGVCASDRAAGARCLPGP